MVEAKTSVWGRNTHTLTWVTCPKLINNYPCCLLWHGAPDQFTHPSPYQNLAPAKCHKNKLTSTMHHHHRSHSLSRWSSVARARLEQTQWTGLGWLGLSLPLDNARHGGKSISIFLSLSLNLFFLPLLPSFLPSFLSHPSPLTLSPTARIRPCMSRTLSSLPIHAHLVVRGEATTKSKHTR